MKTAPRITPSGVTFDRFRSAGFAGIVDRLIAVNELDPRANSFLREARQNGRINELFGVLRAQCDRYNVGEMIDRDKLVSDIDSAATALAALTQAAAEIARLVRDNPGTVVTIHKASHAMPMSVRQFP